MQPRVTALALSLCVLIAAVPTAAAEVYKWTDEKGVVNYSNERPKSRRASDVAVVEDRVSVYAPDKALVDAMQGAREQRSSTALSRSAGREGEADRRPRESISVLAPAPVTTYDPCASGGEANCYGYASYDTSPVFRGRQRVPRLVQPQLPPGAIAGNVTGGSGYTAGFSAQAQALAPRRTARAPRASFTLKDRQGGRGHRSR